MASNSITRSEWESMLAGRPAAMEKPVTACKEWEVYACRGYWLAVHELKNVTSDQKHALILGKPFGEKAF